MIADVAVAIFGNVHILDIELAFVKKAIAVAQAGLAFAERFHLRAGQLEAGLQSVQYMKVKLRFFITGNDFFFTVHSRFRF